MPTNKQNKTHRELQADSKRESQKKNSGQKNPGVQREKYPQRDHDQDLKTPKIPGTLTNNADQSGVAKCQMAGRERNGADEA